MSYHQVQIRKNGPIHAVHFLGRRRGHARATACGLTLNGLETVKNRLFQSAHDGSCGRCSKARPE